MASTLNKILMIVGFLSLFHSAFSAAQRKIFSFITTYSSKNYNYLNKKGINAMQWQSQTFLVVFHTYLFSCYFSDRSYLRITSQEFTTLPLDVSILTNVIYNSLFSEEEFLETMKSTLQIYAIKLSNYKF